MFSIFHLNSLCASLVMILHQECYFADFLIVSDCLYLNAGKYKIVASRHDLSIEIKGSQEVIALISLYVPPFQLL